MKKTSDCYLRQATLQDIDALVALAESDGHSVVRPTHVVERDGKPIGFLSVAAVPMVILYMHSKEATPRETFFIAQEAELMVKNSGASIVCAPCAPTSPIHPYMKKFGFTSYGNMDLFMKGL